MYRPAEPTGSTADAAYSLRIASDQANLGLSPAYFYGATLQYQSNNPPHQLGLRVNGNGPVWGNVYNPSHEYFYETSNLISKPFDFLILDSLYTDNSGFLTVDIYPGYTGLTGENGCVTFEDVPFGTYDITEVMQDGWSNVSGLGEVEIDQAIESFEVVNRQSGGGGTPTIPEPSNNRSSSSGSRVSGGGAVLGASTEGDVLGACVPFTEYHKKGDVGGEIPRLQEFLNEHMGAGLVVNGIFDDATFKAVKALQQKYFDQIISPWGFFPARATGYVYKSTISAINDIIECPQPAVWLEDPKILWQAKIKNA